MSQSLLNVRAQLHAARIQYDGAKIRLVVAQQEEDRCRKELDRLTILEGKILKDIPNLPPMTEDGWTMIIAYVFEIDHSELDGTISVDMSIAAQAFRGITVKRAHAACLRFSGERVTYRDMAEKLGRVSWGRARQLSETGLRMLRHPARKKELRRACAGHGVAAIDRAILKRELELKYPPIR